MTSGQRTLTQIIFIKFAKVIKNGGAKWAKGNKQKQTNNKQTTITINNQNVLNKLKIKKYKQLLKKDLNIIKLTLH